jgi:hypothetical protein
MVVPAVAPVRVAASVRTSLIAWSGSRSRTDELTKAGLFTIGKLAIPVGIVIEASGVVSGIVMSQHDRRTGKRTAGRHIS